jgi:predicted transcriptional regulator
MKKHNGMRPHDLVILLKIVSIGSENWLMKDLAHAVGISQSEVTESLNRSVYAGLIADDKKTIMRQALLDFLENGLKYVYPQHPGAITRGMPTGYSAPPLSLNVLSTEAIVWPYPDGKIRGQSIAPLHPAVPGACERDPYLYELLALSDAIRVGKAREKKIAIDELRKRI